eukprot:snap_masked-scaffold_50-processed-gene-0.39-mRNA-1 protein AED:1.00 eAED:1.00 QI:0/-1/0/0/-1/1/1/0/115
MPQLQSSDIGTPNLKVYCSLQTQFYVCGTETRAQNYKNEEPVHILGLFANCWMGTRSSYDKKLRKVVLKCYIINNIGFHMKLVAKQHIDNRLFHVTSRLDFKVTNPEIEQKEFVD